MVYRYLPDTDVEWRDVWVGGLITALLFSGGQYLIGLYLGAFAIQSVYCAAASTMAVLLWIYYSALVFFYGAEWTHAYACVRASKARLAGGSAAS